VAPKVVGRAFATFDPKESVVPTKAPPTATPQPPSFALRVNDEDNNHPAGISVAFSGPAKKTFVTDAQGYLTGKLPAGFYDVKVVEGCQPEVYVHKGGTAHIGIVDGNTVRGTLLTIWQHRYGPAPPVSADRDGDWPVGQAVKIAFTLQDHCTQRPAYNQAFSTYAYKTSSTLALVGTPVFRSDATGRATVTVRCLAAGGFDLDAYDKANPSDSVDLVQLAAGYRGVPNCVDK
jgi:hypothetical protein